jgi:hypothetical protein
MNFIPLNVSSSLSPALLPFSFRLNRGAKVRTFFYFPNIFKEKNIYLSELYPHFHNFNLSSSSFGSAKVRHYLSLFQILFYYSF